MIKRKFLKFILILGIALVGITAFPQNTEAAKVEQVPNYYFNQYTRSTGRFSQDYGHTYKYLNFVNGYTRSGPNTTKHASGLLTITYKYTYTYYTY